MGRPKVIRTNGGWQDIESAPINQKIELLCRDIGIEVVEIGWFDKAEGGFYTHGELWPIRLDPIAWRPITPIDWKPIVHVAGSAVAVLVILLMIYFLNK